MTVPEQRLCWFLRITAVMLLPAAGAVVMPPAWMNVISEGLGLGALPDLPLLAYLTRSLSALYTGLGVFCWLLSGDVRRYRPLLASSVPLAGLFSVVLIAVDVLAGMPAWWTWTEAVFVLGWTTAFGWLVSNETWRNGKAT